jgi:hypothetical protein
MVLLDDDQDDSEALKFIDDAARDLFSLEDYSTVNAYKYIGDGWSLNDLVYNDIESIRGDITLKEAIELHNKL